MDNYSSKRDEQARVDEANPTALRGKRRGASAAIAAIALVAVIAVAALLLCRCSATDDNLSGVGASGNAGTSQPAVRTEASDAHKTAAATSGSMASAEPRAVEEATVSGGDDGASDGHASGGSGESGDEGGGGGTSCPSDGQPEKHWVIDYAQVWVEDSAARDEEVPVYSYEERSVCNICGADITGNEVAHGKAHMLAGEGSGHHSEVRSIITGYDTVHHDATGHWNTVESGGHWE